jgi:hypothetical protein
VDLASSAVSTSRARTIVEGLLTKAGAHVEARRGEAILLTEATTKLGPCRVRSKTDRPCPRQAVVEIWGMPFCEPCAREQEAYFAIGELTQEVQGLRNEPLVEALGRAQSRRMKPRRR